MTPRRAVVAALEAQLAGGAVLPERAVLDQVRLADGEAGEVRGAVHVARIAALVGVEPSTAVTRQVRAPSTCAVEVPRSWRTPSVSRFRPWM